MELDRINSPFDQIRRVDTRGVEHWSARDLMPLLGYAKWQAFENPLERAESAMRNTGEDTSVHFTRSRKIAGQGTGQGQLDVILTREAAYLVAMNCDPNKDEVAAAQRYFAQQTRRAERELTVGYEPNVMKQVERIYELALDAERRVSEAERRTADAKGELADRYRIELERRDSRASKARATRAARRALVIAEVGDDTLFETWFTVGELAARIGMNSASVVSHLRRAEYLDVKAQPTAKAIGDAVVARRKGGSELLWHGSLLATALRFG